MWGWIFFFLLLICCLGGRAYHRWQANKLSYYLVYLLLDDSIWENHRRTFLAWVDSLQAVDATELFRQGIVCRRKLC